MAEEPFDSCMKHQLNDYGEQSKFPCLQQKYTIKTMEEKRIFSSLFWTIFVSISTPSLELTFIRSKWAFHWCFWPQTKLLVFYLGSWVLPRLCCWHRQCRVPNSSQNVRRIISGSLQPYQTTKVSGKVYSSHPFLHSFLSLISSALCASENHLLVNLCRFLSFELHWTLLFRL